MRLSNRTLLYSMLLSVVTAGFILVYLLYIMPSLYIQHKKNSNLETSRRNMEDIIKNDSIGTSFTNGTYAFALKVPDEGDTVTFMSGTFNMDITVKSSELKAMLNRLRSIPTDRESLEKQKDFSFKEEDFNLIFEAIKKNLTTENENFSVSRISSMKSETFKEEDTEFSIHTGEDYVLFENTIYNNSNFYSTVFGIGRGNGVRYLTMIPFSVSRIDDIHSITMGSLPMILSFLALMSIIFSYVFSRQVVDPVVRLSRHTEYLRSSEAGLPDKDAQYRKDEIGELNRDIDDMYADLLTSMRSLEEEMENRELFLRAGSHQLKTPVAASLLLTDGMIANIGKYADREKYLPEVRKQLLSMQKIINDLLYVSRRESEMTQDVNPKSILEEISNDNRVTLEEKDIDFKNNIPESLLLRTDEMKLTKILENILSNAMIHGSQSSRIIADYDRLKNSIVIRNTDAHIDEEVLKAIFQPFVTSRKSNRSAGLGLYIAKRFAKDLGMDITIENSGDDVITSISL